jgi:hypothetical protein
MPSRKQRRRRQKERRHEYEYVYVDSDGREVEVDPEQADAKPAARERASSAGKRTNGRAGGSGSRPASTRKVDPPSWRRALKRSLIFAPFMFITLYFLDRRASVAVRVLVTAQMLIFFVPFTYLIDRVMYRRLGGDTSGTAPRRPAKTLGFTSRRQDRKSA